MPNNEVVKRAVLTGPPCSGKSATIQEIKNSMGSIHFVPESASIIIGQIGIMPGIGMSKRRFQQIVYPMQMLLEKAAVDFAAALGKSAIATDRGSLDNAVYLDGGVTEFEELFETTREKEYQRYDMVMYFTMPPKEIYLQKSFTNPSRFENYQLACQLASRTLEVWKDHHNLVLVPSFEKWEQKVSFVRQVFHNFLQQQ